MAGIVVVFASFEEFCSEIGKLFFFDENKSSSSSITAG